MRYIRKTVRQRKTARRMEIAKKALAGFDWAVFVVGVLLVSVFAYTVFDLATRPKSSGDVTVNRGK